MAKTQNVNEKVDEKEKIEVEEVLESDDNLELEKLKEEVADYKDKWMRNVAEFDNYKKRNATLYKDAFVEGKKDAILKILPLGDNFETAINMITDEKTKEGVVLLLKQFNDILKNLGVEVIDPTGEQFSPDTAEAVMQVDGEEGEESGIVKTTFRKGYKADDKIIRYAQVSVTK